ncbi:MAG: hypothetical protein LEGION0398_MBIBDBAK_00772 [Legionellaceae bacterium]
MNDNNLKKRITLLLEEYESLVISTANVIITNYGVLKNVIIQQELQDEIRVIKGLLNNDDTAIKEAFKKRCIARSYSNNNTILSISSIPEGICNQLYWKLALAIDGTLTEKEAFTLFFPQVKTKVNCILDLNTSIDKVNGKHKVSEYHTISFAVGQGSDEGARPIVPGRP